MRLINLSHAIAVVGKLYNGFISMGILKENERKFFIDKTNPVLQGIEYVAPPCVVPRQHWQARKNEGIRF